jgi:ABC-type lipoprotein export system ATPase subunit
MPVIPQRLDRVVFHQLKGLNNLDISFDDKNVTGIFGVNGCGKSTILHALACFYKGQTPGAETNYFTRFFKRVDGAKWARSRMTAYMAIAGDNRHVEYRKAADRWTPRIDQRPVRDTYYIGIDSCVPAIEQESLTRTSYYMTPLAGGVANCDQILRSAAQVLGRPYDDYSKTICGSRRYKKVRQPNCMAYTSLSMGAGEQRLFTILERLYNLPPYSILLIDELDLTLHTTALNRLVSIMVSIAANRHLQIVFTSHREELTTRDDINIRHIWTPAGGGQTFCLDHTTPDCLYRLSGHVEKPYEIYVEDDLAAAIVREELRDTGMMDYVTLRQFGDAANAFVVAAGLEIQGQLSNNQLLLTDGDVYRTDLEREDIMKKRYSGNEADKDLHRQNALRCIKQFNLPEHGHPESFIWSLLKTKTGKLADFANEIAPFPDDKHSYLYDIQQRQGDTRENFLRDVISLVKTDAVWPNYVSELRSWLNTKKAELGI